MYMCDLTNNFNSFYLFIPTTPTEYFFNVVVGCFNKRLINFAGMPGTPGGHMQGPPSGAPMHHPDFHHPSPQGHHMGMGGMHSSPTKVHPTGASHHHSGGPGGPFHWPHGGEMPMGAAGGARGENMPLDPAGIY